LLNSLDYRQQQALDELAPTHLLVPSGSKIRLDYCAGDLPLLAVKLQELFGLAETPSVAGGRVPVLLHLLSPAGRPLQVTRDLKGFWNGSYHQVKKEMKGRYPKHPWPDDPWTALPTRRAKPRPVS
jgi:ATP-dependent helicase HrpB